MADPSTTNVNIPPQEGSSQNQRTRRHRRPRQKQANISSTEGLPQTASTSSTMNANVPMQTSGEPSGGGDRNGRGSLNPNASSFTPGGPRRNPPSADAPQEPPRSRNRRSRGRGTGPSTPQQAGQNLPPSPATIPMGPSSNNSESNRRRQGPRPQNGQGPAPRPQNSQGSWRPQNTPGPPQRQHRPTEPIQNLKVAEPNTGGRRLPNINTPRRPQKPQIDPTDLVESLTASLSDGSYECMVCFDKVRPHHKIWTCHQCCHAVFHIKCIKEWSSQAGPSSAAVPPADNQTWRCPGCQHKYGERPVAMCFCRKVEDVQGNKFLTPHACGNPCLRGRSCMHRCSMECHPGPCRPCELTAPPENCFCGKNTFVFRCAEVVKGNVNRACGEVCGKKQSCGIHTCPDPCHDGPCPECPITNDHLCRCGKTHVTLPCGTSPDQDVLCRKPCGIAFRCGEHLCELVCHDARNHGTVCLVDPEVIETCPCGRTKVETLLGRNRESCTEGIPTCKAKCARKLACGHQCERLCHIGECPPCSVEIERICRCGSSRVFMKCASTLDKNAGVQDFLCDRICKSNRLCKRHKCNSVCCPGTEGVHACNAMCGKLLRCGQHNCNFVCGHNGPCHDCYEGVSFDELACACGRTRMYPPIPCGTLPPKCDLPCQRELPCGHVSYSVHTCHPDDEPCPPCVVFVEKQCACGKKVMGNIPCSRQSALSCGSPCLQTLAACGHQCKRFCHNGPCLEEGTRCQGKCLRARPMCGHVCDQLCHETSFCTEERPCKTPIQQTCPCGNRNSDIPCGAWKESIGNPRGAHLPCDESCARLDRNKRLADALNITPSTEAPKPLEVYEEYLHRFALANPAIVKTTEQTLQEFLANPSRKLLHFPHANPRTNRFVAGIVEHYGLTAEVIDAERKQASVVARKAGKGGWAVPNPLLSVACKTFKGKSAAAVVISRTGGLSFSVKTATAFNGVTANGFFVMGLQDGIETKDIEIITEPIVGPISVCWVGENGDCIILPACLSQKTPASGHNLLIDKEPSLTSIFLYNAWATSVHLCRTEDDGTVIRFLPSAWQDKPATSKAWQLPMKTARQVVSQSNPYAALAGNDGSVAAVATVQVVKVDETPTPEDWEEALAEPTVESSWADSV